MRLMICGTMLVALMALPLQAQEAPNPEIEATIQGQFDAFLAEDAVTAFTFASPTIKRMFGTPDRFGMMVRTAYPMVWNPAEVRMVDLQEKPDGLWQRVMVRDQAGQLHFLDYQMVNTAGGWQINAVLLLPASGVGA